MFQRASLVLPFLVLAKAQSESPFLPTDDCPILGPSFPSDFDLTQSQYIKAAIESFPSMVDKLFETEKIPKNATSFYVDVFSSQTNASIYSYSHTADIHKSALTSGSLDDGTIFRIGSVSKLFTVYTLLNAAGIEIFQHPVTQYLPELKGNTERSKIIWEEVTVGALASQQGGVGGFRKSNYTLFKHAF
jgi:CubicO group peptidase (beta-lactamase class C family)